MNHDVPLNRFDLLVSMLMIVLVIVVTGGMGIYVLSNPGYRAASRLIVAAHAIEDFSVDPPNPERLVETARDSMFSLLDRFSGYVGRQEFDQMREEMSGGYGGIGVTIIPHEDGLQIMSVREGGPAGKVGLLTGDILIGTDSVSFAGLAPGEASLFLRGEPGTSINVRVYRPVTGDTTTIALTRERVPLVHVPFAGYTANQIMYIRVLDFDMGTADDIRAAIDSLQNVSGVEPAGIILDLRGNPGGLFAEAYRTANIFLEAGQFIVGTDGRSRWNEETHRSTHRDLTNGLPMAIITNRGSASSSEIVAGALQQAGRAILVGDTTFGKGLVQGFVGFPDGDGMRLTVSRYYFDNGVYLNRFDSTLVDTGDGLAPDHYYSYPELDPFVRSLETSLLLQEFAYQHMEDILGESDLRRFGPILSAFSHYITTHDFLYATPTTEAAEEFVALARLEGASAEVQRLAGQLLLSALVEDRRLLFAHADYIALRLRQIAYEREHGTVRTYQDVLLPNRGDIRFAEELLLNRRS